MDELLELRKELDTIDNSIIELIAKRFQVTKSVGLLKKENNLPSTDSKREEDQMVRIRNYAQTLGLEPSLAERVLRLLIDETVKNHNRIKKAGL